jgi:outer membrane protein TolC
MKLPPKQRLLAVTACTLLMGCAGLPAPRPVPHELTAPAVADAVLPTLQQPLDVDAAARVALQSHPGVRALEAGWRARQAELQQALRLPNPSVALARTRTRVAHDGSLSTEWENEWGLHLPLGAWLAAWLSQGDRLAWGEQQQTEAQAQWLLQLDQAGRSARRAWVQAVAAQQLLRHAEQAWETAQTAAELARRMHAVGNFSRLQWLRWEKLLAEQQLRMAQAQEQQQVAQGLLAQQLGVWRPDELQALRLPAELPALPESQPASAVGEAEALGTRLDLRAALAARSSLLAQLGVVNGERWLQGMALGLKLGRETAPEEIKRKRGLELEWALPLFDRGEARVAAAQARAEQAAWELQAHAQTVRHQVRSADAAVQHAWDRARHHQERLLPLQQQISDEMLLRWNGMFEGPFELLQDAQARLGAQRASTEALRDYWLAVERARQVRWSPVEPSLGASSSPMPQAAKTEPH